MEMSWRSVVLGLFYGFVLNATVSNARSYRDDKIIGKARVPVSRENEVIIDNRRAGPETRMEKNQLERPIKFETVADYAKHYQPFRYSRKGERELSAYIEKTGNIKATKPTHRHKRQTPVSTPVYTDVYRKRLLDYHNEVRRREENVSNMLKLVWNETYAKYARDWSMTCAATLDRSGFPHGKYPPDDDFLSQNTDFRILEDCEISAASIFSWSTIIQDWYEMEKPFYDHDTGHCDDTNPGNPSMTCGHYLTIVAAKEVGCGHSICNFDGSNFVFLVCNYRSNPDHSRSVALYEQGPPCSACPKGYEACDNGLCTEFLPDPFYEMTAFSTKCDTVAGTESETNPDATTASTTESP